MDNIIVIPPSSCATFLHTESNFCLPKKGACDSNVDEGVFVKCGDQWNCNKACNGEPYFMPVPVDGKFMIQTNFNSQGASGGWGSWIYLNLLDSKGEIIQGVDHTNIASRYFTGKSTKHEFQVIEIDVSLIEEECFGIKVATANSEICTQIYKKELCKNLVSLEGVFTKFDCWNNFYGEVDAEGSFVFSNKIWLRGSSKYYGGTVDIENEKVKEITRVYPSEKIPPFMMKYILNKILAAKKVIVDDETFINEGSGNFEPMKSGMFFPVLEFYNECAKSSSSCEN